MQDLYKDDEVYIEVRAFLFAGFKVMSVETEFGKVRYVISPIAGEGSAKVERHSLLTKKEVEEEIKNKQK